MLRIVQVVTTGLFGSGVSLGIGTLAEGSISEQTGLAIGLVGGLVAAAFALGVLATGLKKDVAYLRGRADDFADDSAHMKTEMASLHAKINRLPCRQDKPINCPSDSQGESA